MKQTPAKYRVGVTPRAVIVALLLMPLNSYLIFLMEIVRYAGHPTTISMFYNAILTLCALILVNKLISRLRPEWVFSQGELLTIYVMINISSALVGHDSLQVLVPIMAYPFQFASPENQWQSLFCKQIPNWLSVQDKQALDGFYHGASSILNPHNLHAWLVPVLWWGAFTVVMLFVFLCINVLLRKQWTERERLAYPLVQLPMDMTEDNSDFWRNRLLWAGFAIAAAIDITNGLHYLYPWIPQIPIKAGPVDTSVWNKPWRAVGWLPTSFYPFGIGLGMLLPLDLLFSCWFFFWMWKGQLILCDIYAWNTIPNFPYVYEQSFGAYMGLCFFAILMSRRHILNLARHFFYRKSEVNDEGEPMSYRAAMWGILLGSIFMFVFAYRAGMSPAVILLFFVLYYVLILGITRVRAEFGPPAHDLHYAGPDKIIPYVAGSANMGKNDLTMLSVFYWMNRAYRSHPAPFQLEGFKMAQRAGINYKRLMWAMVLATVAGTFVAFSVILFCLYRDGAGALPWPTVPIVYGAEPFTRLDTYLKAPTQANTQVVWAMATGFSITMLIDALRLYIPWLPLHPVGYAISSSWAMGQLWVCLFLAWAAKLITLRYSGLRGYRKALPFFMGLILGECVVGGLWTMIGAVLNVPTYAFWP